MKKNRLQTVRFSERELENVAKYLKKNPVFESFSSLARVATLSFIGEGNLIRLQPIEGGKKTRRPRFLWDYDLSEPQMREILNRPGLSPQKKWLIERILTQARFDEVWKYLDLGQIQQAIAALRLPQKVKERWEYAVQRWGFK